MLKYVLLGLLRSSPRHGYDLKSVFEELLAGTWPLNVAQVYAALTKLERDGLVVCEKVPQPQVPDRKVYSLTPAGHEELARWVRIPSGEPVALRDELVLKLIVAATLEDSDPVGLLLAQRDCCLKSLADLVMARDAPDLPLPTRMLLDGAVLRVEADLKWLDQCEQTLAARTVAARSAS